MPVIKLSQGLLESLNSRGKDKENFFDSTTKGLMVQVYASSRKTYYFRERGEEGKTIQLKIADAKATRLNVVKKLIKLRRQKQRSPRLLIRCLRCQSHRFQNPRSLHPCSQRLPEKPTFPLTRTYKRSYSCDVSLLNNHVLPFFGDKHLHELTKNDLVDFINTRRASHKPDTINPVIILMRYIYNLVLKWQIPGVDKNHISGTPLLEEGSKKERFLA